MKNIIIYSLLSFILIGTINIQSSIAIAPEEILADHQLEKRARSLSQQLRCLVCQNQSIDDSEAPLAQDLRRTVREGLLEGKTDQQILNYLEEQYGAYILLNPPLQDNTLLLWWAPIGIIFIGAMMIFFSLKKQVAATSQNQGKDNKEIIRNIIAPPPALNKKSLLTLSAVILVGTLFLYQWLGRPDLAPKPIAERQTEIAAFQTSFQQRQQTLQANLAEAKNQVKRTPNNPEAWYNLSQIQMIQQMSDDAVLSLQKAVELDPEEIRLKSALAEALSQAAGGQVTVKARALIALVLKEEPTDPRGLFLQGLALYQDQKFNEALQIWATLYQQSYLDSPWSGILQESIELAIRKGNIARPAWLNAPLIPSTDLIANMVNRLAKRLEDNPDDIEGWLRLGKSYQVLEKNQLAKQAFLEASQRGPDNFEANLSMLEWLLMSGNIEKSIDHAQKLVLNLEKIDSDRIEFLFFAGHVAAINQNHEKKQLYWGKLRDILPKDSPIMKQIDMNNQ